MVLPRAGKYSEMEKFVPENKLKFVDLKYPWSANRSNMLSKSKP